MNSAFDYVAAVVLIVLAIAIFLNIKNGTLTNWLKSKFLGVAAGKTTPASPFGTAA